ncbi:DIS3-like exonuclease 2, partial [Armadillidium vulgare]
MSKKSSPARPTQPVGSGFQKQNTRQTPSKKSLPVFNSYMSLFQVQEKLKRGEVIEGVLRINPKSYEDAYISAPDGGMDIFIGGVRDRNTALHGDVVAALINPPDQWKILYTQLDAFLAEQEHLKHIVYKESNPNPNVLNSNCASASSLSNSYNTNIVNNYIFNEKNSNRSHHEVDCDVVVEEEENKAPIENAHKKKKKHRRGKKKKNLKESVESSEKISTEEKSPDFDHIEVISCPSRAEVNVKQEKANTFGNIMIVPPDQLSECDLTNDDDDGSVHSLSLDFQEHHIHTKTLKMDDKAICSGISCNSQEIPSGSMKVSVDEKKNIQEEHIIQSSQADASKPLKDIIDKNTIDSSENIHKNLKETAVEPKVPSSDLSLKHSKVESVAVQLDKYSNVKKLPSVEQVMRLPQWEKFVQKTATVVRIIERKHPLLAAGVLKTLADKNPHMALFSPFDSRIPRIRIQMKGFVLCRNIGRKGDIDAETESILLENSIDNSEFPESVLKCLPKLPWTIPDEELKRRTDFRKSVIFTIDPSTARDLDDAVSCLKLQNGNFRVGVHIADASYFVPVDSELDRIAAERANSVYLVQKVIPMLPRPLCEELCSLNPGEDRLTFSLVWELTPEGVIVGDWFGRTIIRSCIKLSYEEAQQMIDTEGPLNPDDFPRITSNVSINEISNIVKNLHAIAVKLRNKRAINGALKLNQVRIGFSLNSETKTPDGIFIQEQKDSNRLIEEFMLLANITVAHKISTTFPKLALLRKHPPPHDIQIENAVKFLGQRGINLDATSSKTLSDSIQRYEGTDLFSLARMQLIVNMCSKPMQYARYICSGIETKAKDQHHYALNVPCYTHFTSPIRRYADIIVHRLLASALDRELNPLPSWTSVAIEKIASHCNDKKQASKVVQEVSTELFLSLFVRSVGEMVENGIIIGILDRCIDVLLTRLGVIKRCYMEKIPLNSFLYVQEEDALYIEWKECNDSNLPKFTQKLTYFDMVTVILLIANVNFMYNQM